MIFLFHFYFYEFTFQYLLLLLLYAQIPPNIPIVTMTSNTKPPINQAEDKSEPEINQIQSIIRQFLP